MQTFGPMWSYITIFSSFSDWLKKKTTKHKSVQVFSILQKQKEIWKEFMQIIQTRSEWSDINTSLTVFSKLRGCGMYFYVHLQWFVRFTHVKELLGSGRRSGCRELRSSGATPGRTDGRTDGGPARAALQPSARDTSTGAGPPETRAAPGPGIQAALPTECNPHGSARAARLTTPVTAKVQTHEWVLYSSWV